MYDSRTDAGFPCTLPAEDAAPLLVAVARGDVDAYTNETGLPFDPQGVRTLLRVAACTGNLYVLRDLLRHAPDGAKPPSVCADAAYNGQLTCLQYAYEHGCPWDVHTTRAAAVGGALACLVYAHEQGCPWDGVTRARARIHSVSCLAYARAHGCPQNSADVLCSPPPDECFCAATTRSSTFDEHEVTHMEYEHLHARLPEEWWPHAADAAMRAGHAGCALLALRAHSPCSATAWVHAAARGMWDAVYVAIGYRRTMDARVPATAACGGRLDVLRQLAAHGFDFSRLTAAGGAHVYNAAMRWEARDAVHVVTTTDSSNAAGIDMMRFLYDVRTPWDASVTHTAARLDVLDCLRFAHEYGCPWHPQTCAAATIKDAVECLRYARENGAPWDVRGILRMAAGSAPQCLRYLRENTSLSHLNLAVGRGNSMICGRYTRVQARAAHDCAPAPRRSEAATDAAAVRATHAATADVTGDDPTDKCGSSVPAEAPASTPAFAALTWGNGDDPRAVHDDEVAAVVPLCRVPVTVVAVAASTANIYEPAGATPAWGRDAAADPCDPPAP